MWKIFGVAVLLCVLHQAFGETGCPDPGDIKPCVCTQTPSTYLLCKNLPDAEVLREVFVKSERYRYKEVHIKDSIIQYLPHDMFEKVKVTELYLKNITLSNLFDSPPNALNELRTLHIEYSKVRRGIFWEILKPLKGLRILNVYFHTIRTLGRDFTDNVPKELEQLSLYGTETRSIKPGTFANFTKLDKIAVDAGKLANLTRDIFPTPFNGRFIYFNDNNLTEIPEGLFTQMPKLNSLGLRKNQIARIPEKAFDSKESVSRLKYLFLTDNPLKCDCCMVWLMNNKPEVLEGKCVSPKKLAGKELKNIVRQDFNCRPNDCQ